MLLRSFVPAFAASWTPIADKLNQSTVFIEILVGTEKEGSCTGFVIITEKKYLRTAADCDVEKVLADGSPPTYLKDERKALMVLRVAGVDRPAVRIAKHDPAQGEQVVSLGYGFGLERPMFRVAHLSNVNMDIEGLSGPFVMVDAAFISGHSGGPVVNSRRRSP